MSEILSYLARKGWHPTSVRGDTATGLCMFHDDHEPSLMVGINRRRGEYVKCHTCHSTGTLERLVLFYEFGDDPAHWREAFTWVKEYRGGSLAPSSSSSSSSSRHMVRPTDQQITMLTTFQDWSHKQLHLLVGEQARAYLHDRGLGPLSFGYSGTGYIPKGGTYFQTLVERLREIDADWYNTAYSVGILNKAGGLRLIDRVIFFAQDHRGRAHFYQARVVGELKGKARKWLNPPDLARIPFQMIVEPSYPRIMGTMVVENAISAELLAESFRASAISTGGGGCHIDLSRYEEPFWLCQDQDEAGEKQAMELADQCDRLGYEWHRLRWDRQCKSPDDLILTQGKESFYRALGFVPYTIATS